MALNRSPEFKSLNPKPSAAKLFGTLRPSFEQTKKSSTMQSSIPNFKQLSQVVLKHKIFFMFSYVFLCFKPLAYGHFGPSDLGLNKLGKRPLGNATYLISSI